MNCLGRESAEILLDYCAKTLDPNRAALFDKHLEICADCRKLVEQQTAVWQALDTWKTPAVSDDFDARLFARIGREQSPLFWLRWNWKPAVSLLAACAVLVIALLVRMPQPKQVRPDKVDIEQVEQTLDDLEILAPAS